MNIAALEIEGLISEKLILAAGSSAGAFCALATLATFWLIRSLTTRTIESPKEVFSLVRRFMWSTLAMAILIAGSTLWLATNNREKVQVAQKATIEAKREVEEVRTEVTKASVTVSSLSKALADFQKAQQAELPLSTLPSKPAAPKPSINSAEWDRMLKQLSGDLNKAGKPRSPITTPRQ